MRFILAALLLVNAVFVRAVLSTEEQALTVAQIQHAVDGGYPIIIKDKPKFRTTDHLATAPGSNVYTGTGSNKGTSAFISTNFLKHTLANTNEKTPLFVTDRTRLETLLHPVTNQPMFEIHADGTNPGHVVVKLRNGVTATEAELTTSIAAIATVSSKQKGLAAADTYLKSQRPEGLIGTGGCLRKRGLGGSCSLKNRPKTGTKASSPKAAVKKAAPFKKAALAALATKRTKKHVRRDLTFNRPRMVYEAVQEYKRGLMEGMDELD